MLQPQQGGMLQGLMGQFQQFPDRFKGLMTDPQKQTGLLSSPMFQAGLGLMNANQDPKITAAQGLLTGMQNARQTSQEDEDRQRIEQLRAEIAALMARQGGDKGVGGQPWAYMNDSAFKRYLGS